MVSFHKRFIRALTMVQKKQAAFTQLMVDTVKRAIAFAIFVIYYLKIIVPMLFIPAMIALFLDIYILALKHFAFKFIYRFAHSVSSIGFFIL